MLTQDELKRKFLYKDGRLYKYIERKGIYKEAGLDHHSGYRYVFINKKYQAEHRLVWLYHYGYLPENDIDHVNRVKDDNRVENLREVSRSCNVRNSPQRKDNRFGIRGVTWNKERGKWHVNISNNKELIYLGLFEDLVEAACHRLAAEQSLNWEGCDSSTPAYILVKEYLNED